MENLSLVTFRLNPLKPTIIVINSEQPHFLSLGIYRQKPCMFIVYSLLNFPIGNLFIKSMAAFVRGTLHTITI